jgi:hypothetical protein
MAMILLSRSCLRFAVPGSLTSVTDAMKLNVAGIDAPGYK